MAEDLRQHPTCDYPGICSSVCATTIAQPFRERAHLPWNQRNAEAEAIAAAIGPTCSSVPDQPGLW
jgi:hypothetical protein